MAHLFPTAEGHTLHPCLKWVLDGYLHPGNKTVGPSDGIRRLATNPLGRGRSPGPFVFSEQQEAGWKMEQL